MADNTKDTIYIDVDDEITTVIDKVTASGQSIVALVLPKRAAVFQSIVNMKLLKRKADTAKKHLVLITTESSLLPLAGSVGLHVAKTLASKPEIPDAPVMSDAMIEANEDEPISIGDDEPKPDIDLKSAAALPVGELAAGAAVSKLDKGMETIELDNEAIADKTGEQAEKAAKTSKPKKDKGLKVPNFERFRLIVVLGVLILIVLILLGWWGLSVLPKATINIQTDAANVNTNVNFIMSTSAQKLDQSNNTVPAKLVNETKTYTATVNATGQQNNGQKASGKVQMSVGPGPCNTPSDIPAGTGISSNNLTYITAEDTSFPTGSINKGKCTYQGQTSGGSSNIDIVAQNGGSSYNVSNGSFTVSGYPGVTATGSASGGTDDIIQVVSQADITNAENKIATNSPGAKQDLTTQLTQNNYYPIAESFNAAAPTNTPNASAGTAASSVTVTQTVAYSMYGVRSSDLQTLLDANIASQTTSNQSILNDGLNNASFTNTNGSSSPTNLTVQTTAEVGPNINTQTIKQQIAGKKSADIKSIVGGNSHVTNVTVNFSPFYVDTAPTNLSKITINLAKPTTSSNATNH